MHPTDLAAARRRQPFVPFRMYVSDGSFYDVRHPEFIWLTHRTAYVGQGGEAMPQHAVQIDVLHVTRIEPIPGPEPAPKGNGATQ